jgi:hypothetical protein
LRHAAGLPLAGSARRLDRASVQLGCINSAAMDLRLLEHFATGLTGRYFNAELLQVTHRIS